MYRSFALLLAFVGCALALTVPALSQPAAPVSPLRGVHTFAVMIFRLDPEVEASGLSSKDVGSTVVSHLRRAGITPVTPEEARSIKPTPPLLVVHVECERVDNRWAYIVLIDTIELVRPLRMPKGEFIPARTQHLHTVAVTPGKDLSSARSIVAASVDKFLELMQAPTQKIGATSPRLGRTGGDRRARSIHERYALR